LEGAGEAVISSRRVVEPEPKRLCDMGGLWGLSSVERDVEARVEVVGWLTIKSGIGLLLEGREVTAACAAPASRTA
jgi:hypothetical protein